MLGVKFIPYLTNVLFIITSLWFTAFPLGGLVYMKLIREKNK